MNDELPVIKALIIDDELDICVLLSGLLRAHQIPTEYVTSLKEAVTAIKQYNPQILLLDNHLKDGLGLDFIPFIKEHAPEAYIIMISAFDGKEEHEKAIQSGIQAFISKPFSREDILNSIEEVLKSGKENRVKIQNKHYDAKK